MSAERDDVPMPPHGRGPAMPAMLACRYCGTPTLGATLAQLGARCRPCYERFLREPQPRPGFMADRKVDPKGWARALQAREEAGERLNEAQQTMYRAVIGHGRDEAQP